MYDFFLAAGCFSTKRNFLMQNYCSIQCKTFIKSLSIKHFFHNFSITISSRQKEFECWFGYLNTGKVPSTLIHLTQSQYLLWVLNWDGHLNTGRSKIFFTNFNYLIWKLNFQFTQFKIWMFNSHEQLNTRRLNFMKAKWTLNFNLFKHNHASRDNKWYGCLQNSCLNTRWLLLTQIRHWVREDNSSIFNYANWDIKCRRYLHKYKQNVI